MPDDARASAVAVRRGGPADRGFVRDLGRRTAMSSVSAMRPGREAEVLDAFERLCDFVFARRHDTLIADEAGERIGFLLVLYDLPDEVTTDDQAFVAYTAVEEHARKRGAGRALIEAAEVQARANGLRFLSLMVTEDNAPARALYDRAGLVTERRMLTKRLDP